MTSKHTSAGRFLGAGLFDNLTSFADIELRISTLSGNKERGDAFEIFAEAYFATQKIAQAQEVWPFEAVPRAQRKTLSLDTGRDMGVDGTYLTVDGELRAYQVKFRSRRTALNWEELSTFMGLTDQVSQRVLFTNSESLPSLMQDRSGFISIRGSDLDRLTVEDFESMRQWLYTGQVKLPRKTPLPHQTEALTAIAHGLQSNERATVVMACGTGKSLVALWAAERHDCKTILVLVPSLALVRQLLHEWLRETNWEQLTFMCVCSDPTVAKGADELIVHQADLDFPVTTDSAVVRRFITKAFDGIKIIFSTYQSAQVVAAGMPVGEDGLVQPFDLAIFDEAHKTASRDGTRFSFALEDHNLHIRKRLFFTATPRHYDVRKKDKEGDSALVYSMDRKEVYGPVIHTLSIAEAARRGIICDYKVVISVVTSAMVNDDLLKHGEVLVDGDMVKARQVALQIALQKAVEKYGVSRIFTFHGSVAAARSFTCSESEGIQQHLPDFTTLHVSGEMPTSRREDQMKAFRQAQKAVISNARCLTEGVDVPAVDMVAFISPRKSKVDIVQATGRAMRKSPGKEFGYVMVPLFVEQANDESIEEALQRTGFDDVWDLLGAMREQDDVLVDIIRQMQENKGRTGGYNERRFNERVEVLGPSVSLEAIRESIAAACLESLGVTWDERFGELLAFAAQFGSANPPATYRTTDDFCLGQWAGVQRRMKEQLTPERLLRLDNLRGWTWDINDAKWESAYQILKTYCARDGHAKVPKDFRAVDDFQLGQWVGTQRRIRDKLPVEKKARLETLPGWVWDSKEDAWEIGFRYLQEIAIRNGHANVSRNFKTADGYLLGSWLGNQRIRKDSIPTSRKSLLESLPGWQWNEKDAAWDSWFDRLQVFVHREGSCANIPAKFCTDDGYQLGTWVSNQRKNKNEMTCERRARLEALSGWIWDVIAEQWEIGFRHLQEFAGCEGHCRVPAKLLTSDGYRLGTWLSGQRYKKDSISNAQRSRLEALPGWVWDAIAEQWEIGFRHLQDFVDREGRCNVSKRELTPDGYRLGQWVQGQKHSLEGMPMERRMRLEALPGWVGKKSITDVKTISPTNDLSHQN